MPAYVIARVEVADNLIQWARRYRRFVTRYKPNATELK